MEFRSIEMDLTSISGQTRDIGDYRVDDTSVSIFGFENTGIVYGEQEIEFSDVPIHVDYAIQGFHFETKNDHNMAKLKLEVRLTRDSNKVNILVLTAFRDNSPQDDFIDKPFIMKVRLLIMADL